MRRRALFERWGKVGVELIDQPAHQTDADAFGFGRRAPPSR
jgi:hypothetical protein